VLNGAGIVVLLVIFYFSSSIAPVLQGIVLSLLAPVSDNPIYVLMSRDALISRVQDQDRDLERLKYQSVLYASVVNENAQLRNVLRASKIGDTITGKILARPPRIVYDSLLLDVGSLHNVQIGSMVVSNGIALGKIASVNNKTSIAVLFSSPDTIVDVLIGEPQSVVVARGVGGGAFELSLPKSVLVEKGKPAVLQTTETLILATVVSESVKPTDVSKVIRLSSPVSLSSLTFVQIVPRVDAP
jgi:cell shape-determining protein MreC